MTLKIIFCNSSPHQKMFLFLFFFHVANVLLSEYRPTQSLKSRRYMEVNVTGICCFLPCFILSVLKAVSLHFWFRQVIKQLTALSTHLFFHVNRKYKTNKGIFEMVFPRIFKSHTQGYTCMIIYSY